MIAKRILTCLLIALLIAPSLIASQRREAPTVWKAFAEKLEAGAYVRVRLIDHRQIKGSFIMSDGETLRVKPKTRIPVAIREVKFAEVESIDRLTEGWSAGAKVLAGVGIGVGAVLVILGAVVASWD